MNIVQCPVCTLYLREGITLKEHLDTHPKDKVIEALVSSSEEKTARVVNQSSFQNSFIQPPFQINNHVPNPMQFSIIQPNPEQIQTPQGVFVPNLISNRRYIVSQPGAIIKDIRGFQRQSQDKVFTAVPAQFCNQIITAPQYGSPQLQIPTRTAQPHILTSSTQNINTQGGPAIIYSQLPQPVQNVPNVQQNDHFQSVHNFQVPSQTQAPVVVPQSSSISTSISSTAQFGNSSLQSFSNSLSPVQSNKTPTSQIPPKDSRIMQVVPNTQEFCNASTQVTTISNTESNSNNIALAIESEEYHENKLYEVIKDDNEENEQYEYFDETGVYEIGPQYNESTDEMVEMKEETEYIEDDKSNIESSVEDELEAAALVVQEEQNKIHEDEFFEENDHVSASEYNEVESEIDTVNNIQNDECDVDPKFNTKEREEIDFEEDLSCGINDETEDLQQEEILESKIDIIDENITYSVDSKEQEKEMDLSKSKVNCITPNITHIGNKNNVTISCVSYSNHHDNNKMELDKRNGSIVESNEIKTKKPIEMKNQVSISCVSYNVNQNIREITNKIEFESKRKNIDQSIATVSEEPETKKQKSESYTLNNSVVITTKLSQGSTKFDENMNFKIQDVMYELKAFGNTMLGVHKLDISNIKQESPEDIVENNEVKFLPNICEYKKLIPSTSNTPDVTLHLLPKIKTEPELENKSIIVNKGAKIEDSIQASTSNSLPQYTIQRGRLKKPIKILKIKNAKSKEPVDIVTVDKPCSSTQASQSSVIHHPVKTEPPPPPPYDTKHGVVFCQPGTSSSTISNFPGIDILPVSHNSHLDRAPSMEITPSKYLPSPTLHSPSLQDYTDLVVNTKLDRLTNLHHTEYDSVDTPHWLLRGINILPQVIEDDRISCASPKTLLNLDHQTSFQTFEPDDSGSTSINMQTDEMMPPRGELSGQESLESSVWGYQEDNGGAQYRQWDEIDHEADNVSNTNTFRTKIEKAEPIELVTDKIKLEDSVSILPVSSDIKKEIIKKKHACIYCNKTFAGWKLRKYHMKAEHPELFNEPETGKLLTGKVQLSTSTVISEPSTSFVSQAACPIKFEHSNSFGTQLPDFIPPSIGSIKSKQRQCVTCSEIFDKLKPYQDHIRNVHPLVCPLCSKTFLTKPNLTIHMRTHLKIKPYKCDVCEKSFVTAQKLSDHKNTHTGNAPFPCNMCDRHFKRYSNLAQHKKVIHLKKKKTKDYYCHCGEIFQSRGKLLWHQETHASVPKQCTYCTEKFTHTSSLTRHIRKNHDACYLPVDRKKTDENVTCDICKIVVLKSTLKSHMRIHDTSKPFSCTVCKKSFYTKWNLGLHQWTHVSRTHMPFKCKSCNRGFYSANEYQAHLRSHRNIRPYTCNYCGRKFIRKFNCIRHVREHEAKKKYSCTVCGKTFHRSYYLTAHVRVHNGERPFSCHICGKTSTTKSNHNKHVKTHHARETINTEG